MPDGNNLNAWLEYGDKLLIVSSGVFEQAQFADEDKTLSNPKVIALALLCRTATNFSALKLLLENEFLVEARTMARCCYENLFWIGGLTGKGQEFVEKIVHHNDVNKIKSSRELLQWAKKQKEPVQFETDLETFLAKLKAETPAGSAVDFKSAADAGKVGDAYIIYRVLSTDAAHPSAISLSRHVGSKVDCNTEYLTLIAEPTIGDAELDETLEFGCSALLGVVVGTNNLVGGTTAGKELNALFEEYRELSTRSMRIR
jgi:hypothetical protein